MQFIKYFVVFVALIGRPCISTVTIPISNKPNGFAELEEAALYILKTCYANQDKTIVLLGDYPGNFMKRLSSHQSFSLALLDDRKRAQNLNDHFLHRPMHSLHKVYIVVTIVTDRFRSSDLLATLRNSIYYNAMASVLILDWSLENKYFGCSRTHDNIHILGNSRMNNLLNTKMICRDRKNRTMIWGYNPYTNKAPQPWQFVRSYKPWKLGMFTYYVRKYQPDEGVCKNLDFDKTYDLGRSAIQTRHVCWQPNGCGKRYAEPAGRKWAWLDMKKHYDFIPNFMTYVNATMDIVWSNVVVGELDEYDFEMLAVRPLHIRGLLLHSTFTMAHGTDCKFLISRKRGNMSQLEKIFAVIDRNSWIWMYVTYFVTLIFFKFFLRQSLVVAILNLVRLTCNFGLETVPPNIAPRIYLGCLYFFVVTMQGIFAGNLASLLTSDIAVEHVDSVQNLINLGYKVYVEDNDLIFFEDPVFKGRLFKKLYNENCIPHVLRDHTTACLTFSNTMRERAANFNLHTSPGCIAREYIATPVPWKWSLEERMNKFLGSCISGDVKMSLDAIVVERRLIEMESQEVEEDPKVMTLVNLKFAIVILGIGLACGLIVFILELIIYRIHRKITTRVIVLK